MHKNKNPLAARLKDFDSSAIRHAFELAQEIPDPIDLSIGYPEDNTPDHIKSAGILAIKQDDTRYTPSAGSFELREAIAAKLNRENHIPVSPHQVTVTPGVTTGILLTYLALLDPGDEILLPDPFFPPYRELAAMIGAKPVYVDTFPDFQLTAEQIEPLITKQTKVLVLNTPNNPTGAVYPESELRKIAALANRHGIIVISDEIYEYFAYDKPHFSIGSIYPNTVTLNGFSKAYAMTGWRVGYITGPINIIEAINELQQYIVFSSSSISQKAALAAFRHTPLTLTNKYRSKRDLAVKLLAEQFQLHGAQGAFYAFVNIPVELSDLAFINLLARRSVIILPGSAFSRRSDHVRIAFAADRDTIANGIRVINEVVAELQSSRTKTQA